MEGGGGVDRQTSEDRKSQRLLEKTEQQRARQVSIHATVQVCSQHDTPWPATA